MRAPFYDASIYAYATFVIIWIKCLNGRRNINIIIIKIFFELCFCQSHKSFIIYHKNYSEFFISSILFPTKFILTKIKFLIFLDKAWCYTELFRGFLKWNNWNNNHYYDFMLKQHKNIHLVSNLYENVTQQIFINK